MRLTIRQLHLPEKLSFCCTLIITCYQAGQADDELDQVNFYSYISEKIHPNGHHFAFLTA